MDIIVTPPWSTIGSHNPFLNLSHLSEDQQQQIQQMLIKVRDIFAGDDWDTGCIKELEMDIHLKNNIPLKKRYNAIP